MKPELLKNETRRDIGLIDGFTIAPGEKRTVPWHVASHPLTQAHKRLGELVAVAPEAAEPAVKVEEPKASKGKRDSKRSTRVLKDAEPAEPVVPVEPAEPKPEASGGGD